MKKNYSSRTLVLLLAAICFITWQTSCTSNASDKKLNTTAAADVLEIPPLFERTGELANAAEWQKTKDKVAELKQKLATQSNDVKSRLQIATIYIAEARITGEHAYYYPALIRILDGVLALDSRNFEALVYKASVKLSQHRFVEAKDLAAKASAINPDNAYIYGILVDANVELGNYEEAVRMSDKMQAIKPSLESYSRASYLREIYGDYPGAIEAMKMAVQAGLPGSEPHCWSKNTLAQLYEKTGKWDLAGKEYNEILAMRPSYAFAIEGSARVEKQNQNDDKALELLQKAAQIMPEFSFHEEMADIFNARGEKAAARDKYLEVVEMLKQDENSGHTVDMEMCRVYTKLGDFDIAIKYAMNEYTRRPGNIDVNEALAWLYYNKGDKVKALEYLKVAKKTGSRNPELLKRAGLIEKLG